MLVRTSQVFAETVTFLWIKTISFYAYQANRLEQCVENQHVAGIIIIEGPCSSAEESEYKPLSYDSKANYG